MRALRDTFHPTSAIRPMVTSTRYWKFPHNIFSSIQEWGGHHFQNSHRGNEHRDICLCQVGHSLMGDCSPPLNMPVKFYLNTPVHKSHISGLPGCPHSMSGETPKPVHLHFANGVWHFGVWQHRANEASNITQDSVQKKEKHKKGKKYEHHTQVLVQTFSRVQFNWKLW